MTPGARIAASFVVVLQAASRGECARAGRPAPVATPAPAAVRVEVKSDLFAASVRPILAGRCAPCHEPGGKMYEKLPFDHPDVVAAHGPGVLRRLKGEDRAAVEKWLASLPKNPSDSLPAI